jgi:putative nucleotidyltransferase with HDIG domain
MDLKSLKDRIEHVNTLATIPSVAKRLVELVCKPDVSLTEISRFISSDPVLTVKVLKMVNSPVYGFPGRISSVNQAVLLLGLNTVKGLLFGVTVFDLMQKAMIGLWEHSLGCAMVARLIATKKGIKDPEEASTYGLLHDIGKVILAIEFPKDYEKVMGEAQTHRVPIYDIEAEFFSSSHATVGAWIAEQWSFPANLVEVISFHHRPHLAKTRRIETAITHVSDVVLRARGFGFAGDHTIPPVNPVAWELVNLSNEDIKDILRQMEELLQESADLSSL